MDCARDDGRVVDLDKVNDRIEWSKVSRVDDPTPLEGTNGMMMIMMSIEIKPAKHFVKFQILDAKCNER
jgi:hypothetical protein